MYLEVHKQNKTPFALLSKDFFEALLQSKKIEGIVVIYKFEELMAGFNICLVKNGMFMDKYLGFKYSLARQFNLYFISWLYNLELAKKYNCNYYVSGWTDPEVKASFGAKSTFTRHLVWIKSSFWRKALQPLKAFFEPIRKTT